MRGLTLTEKQGLRITIQILAGTLSGYMSKRVRQMQYTLTKKVATALFLLDAIVISCTEIQIAIMSPKIRACSLSVSLGCSRGNPIALRASKYFARGRFLLS